MHINIYKLMNYHRKVIFLKVQNFPHVKLASALKKYNLCC